MTLVPAILGIISVLFAVAAFMVYLRDTFEKGVRPHLLTWLAFGGFSFVGWLLQVRHGAGPGAWALGLTWVSCFIVFGTSLWKQIQEDEASWAFPPLDWVWLIVSIAIFCFYLRFPQQSFIAAILVTVADLAAYGPTIDQAWRDPYRDCIPAFFLNSIKFIPALGALQMYSTATTLYPTALFIMNAFVAWLLHKRRNELLRSRNKLS